MKKKRKYNLSEAGRQRLSEAAKRTVQIHKPWEHSTGPKSDEGKDTVSTNAFDTNPNTVLVRMIREMARSSFHPTKTTLRRLRTWVDRLDSLDGDYEMARGLKAKLDRVEL